LLGAAAQRDALDGFGGVDLSALHAARAAKAAIVARLDALGGDPRERAREVDLLAFQVEEIANAKLTSGAEEAELEQLEERLANVASLREAAAVAYGHIQDDEGGADRLRAALAVLQHGEAFAPVAARLQGVLAEVDDIAAELRDATESFEEDPEELARVRARRQQLIELRRKYGETIGDVMRFGDEAATRLAELRGRDDEVAALTHDLDAAAAAEAAAAAKVAKARQKAAPAAGAAVEQHLHDLALPRATLSITVAGDAPADDVTFVFCANPGETPLPLRKVASGGELARVMLALRLVLTSGPPTMVFDEVDAGIGGEAAVAVGQALAALGRDRQVLVVTHLPQVAAFADAQVQVVKQDAGERVVALAARLDDDDRVVELSRMLAGDSDSAAARKHAKELLAAAKKRRAG
jgi:DNA repair protein RecN (Recombination protein N)